MAISLQDQLLKAGVASKKQANKAKTEKRKSKKIKKSVATESNAQELAAQKKEKDRLLNLEREKIKQAKANQAQARQIIESNAVTIGKEADISYQFSHLNFVKTIYVDKQIQSQLFTGQLTIAFMDNRYLLIPTNQAHRVSSLQSEWIVELPKQETSDEDDPYAEYVIPDDLMW